MSTYVFKQTEHELWTVGYYDPEGKWEAESDWNNTSDAAARIRFLNGGGELAAELTVEPSSGLSTGQLIRLETARLLLPHWASMASQSEYGAVGSAPDFVADVLCVAQAIETGDGEPLPPQDGDGAAAEAVSSPPPASRVTAGNRRWHPTRHWLRT